MRLPFDCLHASGLLDDIIDELGGLFILQLIFTDPGLGEQVPQIRVQVVEIKAHMTNMPDRKETIRRQKFYTYCKTTSSLDINQTDIKSTLT